MFVGAAFGYFAALLMAPEEGAEARRRLSEQAARLTTAPREGADRLKARIDYAVDEGRRAAAETRAEIEQQTGLGARRKQLPTAIDGADLAEQPSGEGPA